MTRRIPAALAVEPLWNLIFALVGGAGEDRDPEDPGRAVLLAAEPVDLEGEPCLLSVLCDLSARGSAPGETRRSEPPP